MFSKLTFPSAAKSVSTVTACMASTLPPFIRGLIYGNTTSDGTVTRRSDSGSFRQTVAPHAPPNSVQDYLTSDRCEISDREFSDDLEHHDRTKLGADDRGILQEFHGKPVCLKPSTPAVNGSITQLHVDGIGAVPVVKGDPKVLPDAVRQFVVDKIKVLRPRAVYLCNGSLDEHLTMAKKLKTQGTLEPLAAFPDAYVVRTAAEDALAVPAKCYISADMPDKNTEKLPSSVPTAYTSATEFITPDHLSNELDSRFPYCMRGRMMYVVPFSLGPLGAVTSINCIQLTDSPYVVMTTRLVSRVNQCVYDAIGTNTDFIKCVHSVGKPRPIVRRIPRNWPCNVTNQFIVQRSEEREIWSYGAGYGEGALLAKRSVALRLAGTIGRNTGEFIAQQMSVFAATPPGATEPYFIGYISPSGCGKTALAFMEPNMPDWKVEVVCDDVAWLRLGPDERLYATNPDNGVWGLTKDCNSVKMPKVMQNLNQHFLVTNCGSSTSGHPLWTGGDMQEEVDGQDWNNRAWKGGSIMEPSHKESRFAVNMSQIGSVHESWDDPRGVPLTALIFGTRRSDGFPLVTESFNWYHGIMQVVCQRTQTNPDSHLKVDLHHDPFAMKGYMSCSVLNHVNQWLALRKSSRKLPKIFQANFFRHASTRSGPSWPGYGDNIRIIDWVIKRCSSDSEVVNVSKTPIGYIPEARDMNTSGLDINLDALLSVSRVFLTCELQSSSVFLDHEMGGPLPSKLASQIKEFEQRFKKYKFPTEQRSNSPSKSTTKSVH